MIDIKHPSDPIWSPDGKLVAFIWDRAGVANFYVANADGSGAPERPHFVLRGPSLQAHSGAKTSELVYFPHDGDLWQVAASGGAPKPVWSKPDPGAVSSYRLMASALLLSAATSAATGDAPHPSELIVRWLSDGTESTTAHDDVSIRDILWSPDGASIAYTAGAKIIHHDESPSYSGAKTHLSRFGIRPWPNLCAQTRGAAQPVAVAKPGEYGGLAWVDATHLVFDGQSSDFKNYFIYHRRRCHRLRKNYPRDSRRKILEHPRLGRSRRAAVAFSRTANGSPSSAIKTAGTISTSCPRPAAMPCNSPRANSKPGAPPGRTTVRASRSTPTERTIPATASSASQRSATIPRTPKLLTFPQPPAQTSSRTGPKATAASSISTRTRATAPIFLRIGTNAGAQPVRLTDSMPAGMDSSQFVEPQFVRFPGPDGQQVPGWLFVPKNLDRSKKHPAIIWIHGDGVNQNYDGWHVQRNYAVYYSIHQYFLQKGYVVFAPDYRGSIGYGRDWRTGVYMDVGGKDAKDAWMCANYLKTLPYVDADRIGVWGLSYGGFFTLIAMTDQPKLFRAGVDVAGVVDYVMYYSDPYHGDWTASRIGTPEQNPQVYANASPISHIDRLERPLLVLHGTVRRQCSRSSNPSGSWTKL